MKIITTDATLGELAAIMGKQGGQNTTPQNCTRLLMFGLLACVPLRTSNPGD